MALQRIFFSRQTYPAATEDAEPGTPSDSEQLPEERFTSPDEQDAAANNVTAGHESEAADILPQFVKDTVIQAHCRLGHPTRKTFL